LPASTLAAQKMAQRPSFLSLLIAAAILFAAAAAPAAADGADFRQAANQAKAKMLVDMAAPLEQPNGGAREPLVAPGTIISYPGNPNNRAIAKPVLAAMTVPHVPVSAAGTGVTVLPIPVPVR